MRAIVLDHEGDPPALLAEWATGRGIELETVPADRGVEPPDPSGAAFAAVLGSKASVLDADAWIRAELDWIRAADAAGVPVLGICFGGQALAAALGGEVVHLPALEAGWIEVDSTDHGVPTGPWIAYHHDQLVPPPGAAVLAINAVGTHAFRLGSHLGVQFHPEARAETAALWARAAGRDELARDFEETAPGIRARAAASAHRLFDAFLEQISARARPRQTA